MIRLFKKIGLSVLLLSSYMSQAKKNTSDYNILWLSCEDIGPVLGCYGNNVVQTPNIDQVAREGVVYDHAYATVGVCAPSRSSIITGMYPVNIGTHNMRTGKHFTYSESVTLETIQNIYDQRGHNVPQYSVVVPPFVKCFSEYMRKAGYYCTNNSKCDYQFACPITAWDECSRKASYENRPLGQKFFAVYNHGVTHESQIWKRDKLPLTVDPDNVIVPDYYKDTPLVRRAISRKYSNIEAFDKQVGEWIDKLKKQNLLDKTIIVIWSDHGGNLLRQKRAATNSGLRVPLIIRYPDKQSAGTRVSDLVSLMDLGPTMMSLGGIKPPAYMHGKAFAGKYKESKTHRYIYGSADRMDAVYDQVRSVIDGRYVYIRNYYPEKPYMSRLEYREQIPMTPELFQLSMEGKLDGTKNYIFSATKPLEELYDLHSDPDEVKNLAGKTGYFDKLQELRTALGEWQLRVSDKGFIAEQDLIRMMWPNMIQPETSNVIFKLNKKKLSMDCKTNGASIAYQLGDQIGGQHWTLYDKPLTLKKGQEVIAKAIRIGYKPSKTTEFDYE
ncbi:sulfatase [Halosquirtibacter xylanolyticus]|uniref:sulfatase family protein n=1 Tax=Halosquirtibacter xylanolyticus TaxID=3374599 RepID=UPI003749378F|nr:sulfatase [Prolixibacteraceae bacterium]